MQGYFAVNPPILPTGWQLAYTQTGQPYYLDHNTHTTHWNSPEATGYPLGGYYDPVMLAGGAGGGAAGAGTTGVVSAGGRGVRYRGGRGGIDQGKRKTKMCVYWEKGSDCSWGDRCAFAHGQEELRSSGGSDLQLSHVARDNGHGI